MKTARRTLVAAALLALFGCASTGNFGGARIPANPSDFKPGVALVEQADDSGKVEREAMTQTIKELRDQVSELRMLFKLKSASLDFNTSSGDALTPPASQQRPLAAAVSTQALSAAPAPAPRVAPSSSTGEPAKREGSGEGNASSYTALFRFASTTLDDTARAAIAALKPQFLKAGEVRVSAFADPVGDAAANEKIARARAVAVEAELVKLGVDKGRIHVRSAVSNSAPPETSTILGLFRSSESMSRRVDIAMLGSN